MKRVNVLSGVIVGFVIGGTAGYMFARQAHSGSPDFHGTELVKLPPSLSAPAGSETETYAASAASTGDAPDRPTAKAFADRLRIPSNVTSTYEAQQMFAALTTAEMPAAFAAVTALPPSGNRGRMVGMLFLHWGSLDGAGALTAAQKLPVRERMGAEAKALEGWAKVDAPAAWATASEMMAADPSQSYRMAGAMAEFSRHDPAGAMAATEAVSSQNTRASLRFGVIGAAMEDGTIDAVARAVADMPASADREAWLATVFQRWGALDTEAPMNALQTIDDPDLARSAMKGLLTGWVELDPAGAVEYALENHADPLVSGAVGSVLGSAIRYSNESEVRSMMASVVASGSLPEMSDQVIMPVARSFPSLAVELANSLPDERQRTLQTSRAFSLWASNDFTSAAAYYDGMTDPKTKSAAFGSVASQAMRQRDGPAAVVRWIDGFSGPERTRAVSMLISMQGNQAVPLKPEAAAAFAQAINATPGLPPDALERARRLFGPAPTP